MNTLAEIESLTKKFAEAHTDLSKVVTDLNEALAAIKLAHLAAIKHHVKKTAHHHANLKAAVDESRDLFIKPRTVLFHGIKVGLQKGKGGIIFDDAAKVVALIKRHFPEQTELLIHTKEKPDKEALEQLAVADLKRLGCEIADAGDQIVIKPTDSEVDKIVTALLKDATADEKEEAA